VLTFDTNGNTLTANGTHNTFTYDGENRLTGWVYYQSGPSSPQSGDKEVLLAYDGFGRLRQRLQYVYQGSIGGGGAPPPGQGQSNWALTGGTNYFYDPGTGRPGGWLVIQERSTNGTPTVSYTHGNDLSGSREGAGGIGGLLARSDQYSSGNWTRRNYYMADALGNITYMLSTNQAMVATYRYDPFGRVISQSGSLDSVNSYQFSSKMYDSVLGLSYYGYRWYDANLQRWPNRDPLEEEQGLNLYDLAYNDPVDYVDTLGLQILIPIPGPRPPGVLPWPFPAPLYPPRPYNPAHHHGPSHPPQSLPRPSHLCVCEVSTGSKSDYIEAKKKCIEECIDELPTGTYNGDPFYKCLRDCMERAGFKGVPQF